MSSKVDVRSITYLKTRTADLVQEVRERAHPVTITQNGEAAAVLMDVATYRQWRAALVLHKIVALSEADIAAGRTVGQDEALRRAGDVIAEARKAHR